MTRRITQLTFLLLAVSLAGGQTGQVIHAFTGVDGSRPFGLISDAVGNFYGVAQSGGGTQNCCGTVFELSPAGTGWKTTELHRFAGGPDGANPIGTLVFDAHGNLFGVTESGGTPAKQCACGTVFELSPKSGGGWTYTQIYRFQGNSVGDGSTPDAGVIVDAAGNVYGTTQFGGPIPLPRQCLTAGCGTVFELSPSAGSWTETVLYYFTGDLDGQDPRSPLMFDANGNLDGATSQGGGGDCGDGCGTIFQLVPSGGTWTENVLHRFDRTDGWVPYQALTSDAEGNLYGTTNLGGANSEGTVFELSPGSGGSWTLTTLYDFPQNADGSWPAGGLTRDASGNLYGTASGAGAHDAGTAFKLAPALGGGYTFSILVSFGGGNGGSGPNGNLVLDSTGNLYGTTGYGGAKSDGIVFKIVP